MNSQKAAGFGTIGVLVGVLVVIIAGGALLASNQSADPVPETKPSVASNQNTEVVTNTTVENKVDIETTETDTTADLPPVVEEQPLAAGIYTEYNESLLENAEDGTVLLFFHATWCPSCRALEKDVNANLENIPNGVTLLKLDYDTETALKKKYGVVRQHTLVQVDADGNLIKTLTGLTNTLDQVTNQI